MKLLAQLKEITTTEYGRIVVDFAIIILLSVIVFRTFLFSSGWPAGGDVLGWISREYLFGADSRWIYMWRSYSFGFVEGINSMDFLLALIYTVCNDPGITIKIFMFFSYMLAGFSMYAFSYHYTRKCLAAIFGSLIYILNQWLITQLTEAHIDLIFSYAFAPLLFLLLARTLEKKRNKDILVLTLAFSVFVTSFHPEAIVIYGIFIPLFVVLNILMSLRLRNFGAIGKHLVKMSSLVIVISFFLSAFLLIPFILNARVSYYSSSYKYPLEDAMGYSHKNVIDAFILTGTESWGYAFLVDIPKGLSLLNFSITPLLLGLFFLSYCIILFRRDKYTVFFTVSTLVSIFISVGPNPPLGSLFVWAWFNVPHFAVFRAASRWVMMIAFSNAFFISLLANVLLDYIQKKRKSETSELYLKAKIQRNSHGNKLSHVQISFDDLNDFMRKLHKSLHFLSIVILILIFLSGFLSSWFLFNPGLQNYTPSQVYMDQYKWIANQSGDFKIVTVNNSPAEWLSESSAQSDFAFGGMLTDVGWGHDLGHDSSFIHDKPTLQNGGWEFLSRGFVDHLRFQLVRNNMTDELLNILGPFNYKYFVLPPYINAGVRNFFLNQKGSQVVYDQNSSIILKNEFYTSHIFSTNDYMLVTGGYDTFQALSKVNSFNLNKTALIFTHQINELPKLNNLFNGSKALVFVNSDILDLTMSYLKQYIITAADYGASSFNYSRYWATSSSWRKVGRLVLGGNTLTTSGANSINIPFSVESDGRYDFWLRIAFGQNRGELRFVVDHALEGKIQPTSSYWSKLQWIKVTDLELKSGNHIITLRNDGTGYNDVDSIAVVKSTMFQAQLNEVLDALKMYGGRVVNVLEAESAFNFDITSGWSLALSPYNDFVLRAEGSGRIISPLGFASASSVESNSVNVQDAIDGNLNTRWASSKGLPQWLQIEWATPQELSEVQAFFEHAYAQDYLIQSWNGTDWIDQFDVKGNTMLRRVHEFQYPIKTTKLRINVTSASDFNMVSIWEFEVYSQRSTLPSTKIFIPREANYTLAARLSSGPECGILDVGMDNFTSSINCSNPIAGFKWYELNPVFLRTGEYMMNISAVGRVDVDEIILYSLEVEEDTIHVDKLFESDSISPYVSYEKVSPVQYRVHVECSNPFLLVFSDSYHPLWKAFIDNSEVSPVVAYSIVNGFFINKTGEFDVTLYFTGQIYADLGLKISAITFVVVVVILIIPSKVFKRFRNSIRRWRQA